MRWLLAVLGVLCALLVAVAAGIGWLVGTESGLHWAASHAPGARFEGLRGRLAGEVTAERAWYESEGVRVEAARLALRAHLAALLGGRLTIDPLRAEALHLELKQTAAGNSAAPELPLRLHLANMAVGELSVRRGEARYVIQEVRIQHARIGDDVSLAGSFYWPDDRFATRARLELRGTLARIEAHAVGEVAGIAAEARGVLAPQSAQRLQSLEAHAGPVDLANFDLPWRTALSVKLRAGAAPGDALAGALSLDNALAGPLDAERLPFTRLDTRFLTDFASARLEGLRVALAGGASVQGDASLHPGHVEAKLIAAAVDLRSLHSRLRRTALHGPLQVVVAGERQWARGRLAQEGIGITAQVLRTGDALEVQELRALAEGGEVNATGTATLSGAMPFSARLEVRGFDPAAFGDYPAGSLSGSLVAKGRLEPRDVALEWKLDDSAVYGHSFRSSGTARLVGQRVTQADAELRLGANRLTARGAYGRPSDQLAITLEAPRLEEFAPVGGQLHARGTLRGSLDNPRGEFSAEGKKLVLPGGVQLQELAVTAKGTLAAHEAQVTAREPQLALELAARLRGGWNDARGWAGELLALQNSGAYPLESVAPAPLRVAPGRVELGRLEARLGDGRIVVQQAAWSPARLASSGEFSRLPAQWLIVAAGLDDKVSATLLLDGEWQVTRAAQLDGFVRVRRVDGDVALSGARPVELGLERAALEVRFDAGRASGEAQAASRIARVAVRGELMPSLALQGKLEFAELGKLTRPFLEQARIDGRLSAELRASGTLAKPVLHGTLAGEALAFEMPQYGVALKDGTLKAVLEGDSLKLESLAMRGGEGRLAASGTLPLGVEGTARIDWRAEKLALLDRPDLRLVASGAGEANYDGKRVALTGDLRADRGHLEFARDRLPELGDDVVVLGRDAPKKVATGRLPVALDLRLDLGDELVVRGYGFDGRVSGLVELSTSTEGELRAFGRLTAVNATFLAYGQRLDVDPGVVIFDGPIDNPTLQITAWRRNQAVEAGVQVTGTVRAPSVNLVSQPPVPEGERLSWLVLGRAPSGATQADLGLLQAAAGALLSGGDSVPLDRRIARRFGLDEVSLRGSGELTDRVVAVGKRLSDRLYVSYEQGIGAVVSNLIKLDYALGRRWTLRAETGTTSGGGLFYRYSWD
jgi:translocation and assembly module TamB